MRRLFLLILVVGMIASALWLGRAFPAANATPIDLDLLWVQFPNVEIWWMLIMSAGFGGLIASLVVGFAWLRGWVLNRRYRKTIKRLESELHQLRSLPLAAKDDEPFAGDVDRAAEGRG